MTIFKPPEILRGPENYIQWRFALKKHLKQHKLYHLLVAVDEYDPDDEPLVKQILDSIHPGLGIGDLYFKVSELWRKLENTFLLAALETWSSKSFKRKTARRLLAEGKSWYHKKQWNKAVDCFYRTLVLMQSLSIEAGVLEAFILLNCCRMMEALPFERVLELLRMGESRRGDIDSSLREDIGALRTAEMPKQKKFFLCGIACENFLRRRKFGFAAECSQLMKGYGEGMEEQTLALLKISTCQEHRDEFEDAMRTCTEALEQLKKEEQTKVVADTENIMKIRLNYLLNRHLWSLRKVSELETKVVPDLWDVLKSQKEYSHGSQCPPLAVLVDNPDGLRIVGRVIRENGKLVYRLLFENDSALDYTANYLMEVDENSLGLALAEPFDVKYLELKAGEYVITQFPLLISDLSANVQDSSIRVRIKRHRMNVAEFCDTICLCVLLGVKSGLTYLDFYREWHSLDGSEVSRDFNRVVNHPEAVVHRFEASCIYFVSHVNLLDEDQELEGEHLKYHNILSFLAEYENGPRLFIDLRTEFGSNRVKITIRSSRVDLAVLLFPCVDRLLTSTAERGEPILEEALP